MDKRDKQDNQTVPIVRFVHNFFRKFYKQRFLICCVRCVKSKRKKKSCVNMQSHFTQLTHLFSILLFIFSEAELPNGDVHNACICIAASCGVRCRHSQRPVAWERLPQNTFDRSRSVCQKYLCVTYAESNKGGEIIDNKFEFVSSSPYIVI